MLIWVSADKSMSPMLSGNRSHVLMYPTTRNSDRATTVSGVASTVDGGVDVGTDADVVVVDTVVDPTTPGSEEAQPVRKRKARRVTIDRRVRDCMGSSRVPSSNKVSAHRRRTRSRPVNGKPRRWT
jgi:hypothetical protein